jgi:hypothetical protein
MALQRMRWSNTGATLIGPRDGATLRSIADPAPPRRRDVHIHIHAAKVADQAAPGGGLRPFIVIRMSSPKEAGFRDRGIKLRGRDAEGHAWGATIYGPHGRGYSAEDSGTIFAPSTGDANAGEPGEADPARGSDHTTDRTPVSLCGLAALLSEHYRRK